MRPATEPAYPAEIVLAEGPEVEARKVTVTIDPVADAAERAWNNRILIWGRGENRKVTRLCQWAQEVAPGTLASGWCEPGIAEGEN